MLKDSQEHDLYSNGEVHVGPLPPWMRVEGTVVWYVFQGPYNRLPEAWSTFMKKLHSIGPQKLAGPPGDVYVCDPMEHKGEGEEKLTTVLWSPLKG